MDDTEAAMPMPVAVIGCGYWGRNLVRNFAELGALAAICDPDQATASQLSARYGAPVTALEPMLRDQDRVVVLLDLLGRTVRAQLEAEAVEAA